MPVIMPVTARLTAPGLGLGAHKGAAVMNRPALGPPTPSARAAPGPLQGPGTLGSAPLTPTKCIAKAGTRQDRPTAKERCQETLFFLPFRKTLPGPGTAQSLPRTHNRPEPFPRASRQPRSLLHPSFQVRTCWAGHRAPQSRGATAPWPGPRCLGSGASVYLRGPVLTVPMSGCPRRREG